MKPPLRQVRSSPRKGLGRRPNGSSSVVLRNTVNDGSNATSDLQSSNIRVAVRVRPLNSREITANLRTSIKVENEKLLVFDPKDDDDNFFYHGVRQNNRDFTKKTRKNAHFSFDGVFDCEATNKEVFEGTTKAVVDAVLEGFNCSVFAYGATGAGKTHTMLGSESNPGIIFLTVMDLYQRMEELRGTRKFEISVSYLEVYNENVRDLLAQSNFLAIRDNGNDGIAVTGLSLVKPNGADDLLSLLKYGNSNRTQHPTDHNAESSRSHAVFQVWIKQSDRTAGLSTNFKMAKMSLIDLAGSERGCATGHMGERFREGNNINRSLLALGNCINALAEGRRHVPYRDSKLTRLLQDSLGGNCKTVMIAAVSPSSSSYEDTYNTLKYADRAKSIKSNVKKNERSVQLHVTQYEKMISDLRAALAVANEKVKALESAQIPASTIDVTHTQDLVIPCEAISSTNDTDAASSSDLVSSTLPFAELKKLREEWSTLLHERREIQHKLSCLEYLEKEFQQKIALKNQKNDRVENISLSTLRLEKLRQKLEREVSLQKPKLEIVRNKKEELKNRLTQSMSKEADLSNSCDTLMQNVSNEDFQQLMRDAMRMKQLEVVLQEVRDQNSYLTRCLQAQTDESKQTESLLLQLMKTTKSLYLSLRIQGAVPSYMESDFNNLVALVDGGRGVCWADEKEQMKKDVSQACSDTVTLSPLTESDVRYDVPPSSVLCHTRLPSPVPLEHVTPSSTVVSQLDSTVVLHSVDLDSTFDVNTTVVVEPNEPVFKVPALPIDSFSSPMPLTDLPTNVRVLPNMLPNAMFSSPANKENLSLAKSGSSSSIPIRTPSKELRIGQNPPTPNQLRKGHMFSKSSTDLSSISQKPTKVHKPGYMAATASSKIRETGPEPVLLAEPPASSSSTSSNRFVSNSFKKIKKSVSTFSLSTQRR